jgi:hypothetical protein
MARKCNGKYSVRATKVVDTRSGKRGLIFVRKLHWDHAQLRIDLAEML